jgi:hypothetical protein
MTAEPVALPIMLTGDDGHISLFPRALFDGYRRPPGEAAAAAVDPVLTGAGGSVYVVPWAAVEGYRIPDDWKIIHLHASNLPAAEAPASRTGTPPEQAGNTDP